MKPHQKIILLAIVPLLLALCAIAATVRFQATALARQQHIYLLNKKSELKRSIDAQSEINMRNTLLWITGITIASTLIIVLYGLALNKGDQRLADAKLKALAQRVVQSQEAERVRLARDLHDGISQWLVSIKLQVESGIAKLETYTINPQAARSSLERAAQQLNEVLAEVRRISHDLRPAILDDLGLAAALDHLAHEFSEHSSIKTSFELQGSIEYLTKTGATVLFRITQEALTNIKRHSQATNVKFLLTGKKRMVRLTIIDNGIGFDLGTVVEHPKRGIGLRNMHERMEDIGGTLQLSSSSTGTQLIATLPLD